MTDEEKLLSPIVQFTVGSMAAAEGLEQQPSFGSTILDMSLRSVVPDVQMTGPIIEGLRLGYSIVSGENYTDFFRNAPAFNQKDLDLRFESWQGLGDYSAAVGGRAWNYFGGRSVLSADVNGVDNGRGEAPESLETALRRIPWVSPMINRMVKIQVGSPNKDGTVVREERKHLNAILDKCAARLLDKCEGDTAYHYQHPKEYEADIARFARTYDLNDHDQANLRKKYLNAFNQRRCRESLDRRALKRMIQEGRRQGMTESEIWVLFGDR